MLGRVPSENTPLVRMSCLISERSRPMAASMRLSRSLKSESARVGQRELGLISTVVLEHGVVRSDYKLLDRDAHRSTTAIFDPSF